MAEFSNHARAYSILRMADCSSNSYILLRDISEYYPRGILLELNKDGSYGCPPHGVYLSRPTIPCINDGDLAPLSEEECCLLYGISSDADRYDVYSTPGKLEWGRSLKVGDTVLARLPGVRRRSSFDGEQKYQYTTAIIRWCGRIKYLTGYMFGVEIVVSS